MRKQYQYILVCLSLLIVYMLYLIFTYKYSDIQKDYQITQTNKEIWEKKGSLIDKENYFAYINTNAYKDKVAKNSQNKKNPGEEVVYIVTKDEVDQYKKIETQDQIYSEKEPIKPTYWMTNLQKWIYYIFNTDIRS